MRNRFLKLLVPVLSLAAVPVLAVFPIEPDALSVEQPAALPPDVVMAEVAPVESPTPQAEPQSEVAIAEVAPLETPSAEPEPATPQTEAQPEVALAAVTPEKSEPQFIQYRNRIMVFTPWHQGYERIENDALYVGLEGYAAHVKASHHKHLHENTLFNAELRLGYNFFYNGRDHLTPFVGGGYVQHFYKRHSHVHHRPGVAYSTAGFLYSHEFNSIFGLGFNGKFLLGGPVSGRSPKWGGPVVGVDFAMPWIFRFGCKRHWDVRIEPFYMFLHGSSQTQNYAGFRSNVGYRF